MRRTLFVIELIGCVAFSIAFLLSFNAEQWVLDKSKDVIQLQIRPKADIAVDLAEEGLRSRLAARYLSETQIRDSVAELELYRSDPPEYIRSITGFGFDADDENRLKSTIVSGLAAKFLDWKARIREHFSRTFDRLMLDLRLFLVTTAVAFAIAAFMIAQGDRLPRSYFIASAILALATVWSAFAYINQNWFFTVLLNDYMGWGYPAGIGLLFGWLLFQYYSKRRAASD